jgi:transcriptional regulator with XRE-family HTH domain
MGIKQEFVAGYLQISQQRVSQLEKQRSIDDTVLKGLTASIGITPEFLVNFKLEEPDFAVQQSSEKADIHFYNHCETNPFDLMISLFDAQISGLKEKLADSQAREHELKIQVERLQQEIMNK